MTKSILLKLKSNEEFNAEYTNLLTALSKKNITIQPLEGVLCCMLTSDVDTIKDLDSMLKESSSWEEIK